MNKALVASALAAFVQADKCGCENAKLVPDGPWLSQYHCLAVCLGAPRVCSNGFTQNPGKALMRAGFQYYVNFGTYDNCMNDVVRRIDDIDIADSMANANSCDDTYCVQAKASLYEVGATDATLALNHGCAASNQITADSMKNFQECLK